MCVSPYINVSTYLSIYIYSHRGRSRENRAAQNCQERTPKSRVPLATEQALVEPGGLADDGCAGAMVAMVMPAD